MDKELSSLSEEELDELLDDLVSQPTEGLLYDLNLLPEVLSAQDKKYGREWLIMNVIKKLKEKYENGD